MKIYKSFIGLTSLALFFSACQSNNYKIEGTAEGLSDGDTLYIEDVFGNPTDTLIVNEGKFEIKGEVDSAALYLLSSPTSLNPVAFFKEPGTITIHYSADGNSKVSGTKANDSWQAFNDMNSEYAKKAEQLMMGAKPDEMTEEQQQAVYEKYQALQKEMMNKVVEFAKELQPGDGEYYVIEGTNPDCNSDHAEWFVHRWQDEWPAYPTEMVTVQKEE